MTRTNTTSRTSFSRPGSVTYDLPDPSSSSTVVTITLPPNSTWTSGLHWHETHTEHLLILRGSALVTLSGITKKYTSSSGVITIPPFARHEWRRGVSSSGEGGEDDGEELVVQEWTVPGDGGKEGFFRNLSSLIEQETNPGPPKEWWLQFQLFLIFSCWDNFPVLHSSSQIPVLGWVLGKLGLEGWFEWLVTHFVLWVAVLVGGVVGLRGVYEEWTPRRLLKGKEE